MDHLRIIRDLSRANAELAALAKMYREDWEALVKKNVDLTTRIAELEAQDVQPA